jgi:hypothetical protein
MRVVGAYGRYVFEDEPFNSDGRFGRLFRSVEPRGLVYKLYWDPVLDEVARKQLLRVRQLGRQVLVQRRQVPGSTPEACVNWPIDTVEETGAVLGVVIPEIPPRFFKSDGAPRTLDFLLFARADPPPPDAWVRVSVLIRLAEIFRWLHDHQLVHGDLSAKNAVWCAAPAPATYLIDCDGLQAQYPPPQGDVATEGWIDPRLVEGQITDHDHYSDWYALALAMYRGLLLNPGYFARKPDGSWPAPARLPANLDPRVRDHIRRTLGRPLDVKARTTPEQWVLALISAHVRGTGFDERSLSVLDRHAEQFRRQHAQVGKVPRPMADRQPGTQSSKQQRGAQPSWINRPHHKLSVAFLVFAFAAFASISKYGLGNAATGVISMGIALFFSRLWPRR